MFNTPPMSNTERQRRFRERNPGYYGRLHRRRSAMVTAPVAIPAAEFPRAVLLLPAPVEQLPLFTFAHRQQELVPLTDSATTPEKAAA